MMMHEFNALSTEAGYGACGAEYWDEIKEVYMNTTFTKAEMVDLYWNHTGYFEQLAQIIRERHEAQVRMIEKMSEIRRNVETLKGKVVA